MKSRYYLILLLGMPAAVSCEDFLTRLPQDELTPETYFTTEAECQLYTNEFYNLFPEGSGVYGETDDYIIPLQLSNEVIGNRTVPSTSGSWNWDRLRDINFFLQHSNQCEDENVRLEYEGLARFFRAYFYFDKVKRFGDVPWVDRPLAAEDSELYKGRDDRKVVMQHILEFTADGHVAENTDQIFLRVVSFIQLFLYGFFVRVNRNILKCDFSLSTHFVRIDKY